MRCIPIPRTDLMPSALCLGTADLGSAVPAEAAWQMFDLFRAHGGNFLDTALVYANWTAAERSISEKTIGRWLAARGGRDQMVLATKGGHPELGTMHIPRLSPAEIRSDLEQSLRHLGVETIDLYYLHRDDPARPVGEIMDVLHEQVRAGKVRYVGCSNWRVERIHAAREYAVAQGWPGFVANEPLWNLAVLDYTAIGDPTLVLMDEPLWHYHRTQNLPAIPYSSQANGLFQHLAEGTLDKMRPHHQRMYAALENQRRLGRVQRLVAQTGLSVTQLVLSYLTSQPFPTIPIMGCRSVEQLRDSLTAAEVVLSAEQVRYLERGDMGR
jgi:aryl-alcohol dehydrogenase-like predicted oxidoreductase